MKRSLFAILAFLALAAGCRSPDAHRQAADRAADRIIRQAQTNLFGGERPFTIERPADALRRRLLHDQQLPTATNAVTTTNTSAALNLTFVDALRIGARNNNAYQDAKEEVFRAALELDLQQYAFDTTFSGLLTAAVDRDSTGEEGETEAGIDFTAGLSRKLRGGATLAANLTLDVARLLTGDGESSFGLLVDTSITIPLLRGAGREIVTEPLTQAQRDVLYALLTFERYKQDYAVQVATDYLAVLRTRERTATATENLARLEENLARATQLARAGRLLGIELDQTHQDVLRARNRLVSVRQEMEAARDRFKRTLGLPADARIVLGDTIMRQLQGNLRSRMERPGNDTRMHADDALCTALRKRLDLAIALRRLEDARRKIRVTANALKAGVDLRLTGSTSERRFSGGTQDDVSFGRGTYSGGLDLDLPWNRREERNAYRTALIAVEKARRELEAQEDNVKQEVRQGLRDFAEACDAYRIQSVAVQLAERRAKSAAMFLESGRAQTRDLLEAREALVTARDALTDAIVNYYTAYWGLLRDTGELQVDTRGMWNLDYASEEQNP